MTAILPTIKLESDSTLSKHLMPHQVNWCKAEEPIHAQGKQAFALAEKSIRIGWTWADSFKNVRKRILHRKRDYLFVTKDYPSALEYIRNCYEVSELFDYTRAIISHGEDYVKVPRLDKHGQPTAFTDEIKFGYLKYDNESRILAFSAHPQAMAVYGGDVGLDEFAKHPNAELLWETAQGRVTWGGDLSVWSAHNGEDTLFNQFAREAQAGTGPWNLYYRVTMPDAIDMGLLDTLNKTRKTRFTREQFLADCRARSRTEEIYEQAYLCNPAGASSAAIVEWSAIERCRFEYEFERVHLEAPQIPELFGEFDSFREEQREQRIAEFLRAKFPKLLSTRANYRLGFDVAASGQGDLAAIYIDEVKGDQLWLRALLTCRTEDWHFLTTTLHHFLRQVSYVQGAGDESGLGRQICWEAAKAFPGHFTSVNFTSKKQDLGFALMNQLAVAEKRFPKSEQDIAADYFALRKLFHGKRWIFCEGKNHLNPASHCDIAWAGALSSYIHAQRKCSVGVRVG